MSEATDGNRWSNLTATAARRTTTAVLKRSLLGGVALLFAVSCQKDAKTLSGPVPGKALIPSTASPTLVEQVVTWSGNGTDDGVCHTIGSFDDLNPPSGVQGWLFILTHPYDGSGSVLRFRFDDGTHLTVPGQFEGTGTGSYHYVAYTTLGAKLLSAEATNGSELSVLTVSHCESGNGLE